MAVSPASAFLVLGFQACTIMSVRLHAVREAPDWSLGHTGTPHVPFLSSGGPVVFGFLCLLLFPGHTDIGAAGETLGDIRPFQGTVRLGPWSSCFLCLAYAVEHAITCYGVAEVSELTCSMPRNQLDSCPELSWPTSAGSSILTLITNTVD